MHKRVSTRALTVSGKITQSEKRIGSSVFRFYLLDGTTRWWILRDFGYPLGYRTPSGFCNLIKDIDPNGLRLHGGELVTTDETLRGIIKEMQQGTHRNLKTRGELIITLLNALIPPRTVKVPGVASQPVKTGYATGYVKKVLLEARARIVREDQERGTNRTLLIQDLDRALTTPINNRQLSLEYANDEIKSVTCN